MDRKWITEATRDEYTAMLVDIMAPTVNETFQKLYRREDGSDRYKNFQHRLRSVRYWNTLRVQEEVNKITGKCSHVRQLLTAVMYAFVRVMTTLYNDAPSINLQVPTLEKFVHTVYDSAAEYFYEHLDHWKDVNERRHQITRLIVRSVKKFLPMEDILKAFLGADDNDENEKHSESDNGDEWRQTERMLEQPVAEIQPVIPLQPLSPVPASPVPASPVPAVAPMEQPVPLQPVQVVEPVPVQEPVHPVSPVSQAAPPAADPPDDFFSDADDEL